MGTFITIIIVFVIIAIILRALRRTSQWVDYISYGIIIISFISTWIGVGFFSALFGSIILGIIIFLLTGIGSKTKLERFGRTYSFECDECGLGDLDLVEDHYEAVTYECPRCGRRKTYILNH